MFGAVTAQRRRLLSRWTSLALLALLGLGVPATAAANAAGKVAGASEAARTATSATDRGIAAFEHGDFAAAALALGEALQGAPEDHEISLLYGLSLYRLGMLRDAEPRLMGAARSEDPETAATARLFLGLIASRAGEAERARQLVASVADLETLEVAADARALLGALSPAPWTLGFDLRMEYDSNVPISSLSATPPATFGQTADAAIFGLGSIAYRPFAGLGLTIGDTVSYRKHFQLSAYDVFLESANLRWDYLGATDRASLAYAFDISTLGGPLFYVGNTLEAAYRRAIAGDLGLGLRYDLRRRDYDPVDYVPYTGWTHSGVLEASLGTPETQFEVELDGLALRELTSDPAFNAVALGGRILAREALGPLFGAFGATALERAFDLVPTDGTPARRDTQLIGEVTLGASITAHLEIQAGSTFVRNISNLADFDYQKWTAHLGVELSLP